MKKLESGHRLGNAAVGVLIALVAAAWWHRGTNDDGDWLACERLNFPCTLAEVDLEVLQRSLALGEEAAARMESDSLASVATWLRGHSEAVEVLESNSTVAFRLDGGRRIWLQLDLVGDARNGQRPAEGPVRSAERQVSGGAVAALLGVARRWSPSPPLLQAQTANAPSRRGGVVGIDIDGDGKITQLDARRALILVPDPHRYLAEAQAIRGLLESTSGYDFEGSVQVRLGPAADADEFAVWNDYDLVHVVAGSATACWSADQKWVAPDEAPDEVSEEVCSLFVSTGTIVDPSNVDGREPRTVGDSPNSGADTPEHQASANDQGLEIFAVVNGQGELEWRIFATNRFFKDAYPSGVRRAVVSLNVSNEWGLTSIGDVLAGSPAQSTVLMWKSARSPDEATELALRFFEAVGEGWAPSDVFDQFLGDVECEGPFAPACGAAAKVNVDLRIREVVAVRAPADSGPEPALVVDGQALESLMDDALAVDPTIDFVVDVHGIMPADEDIPVRLELDGQQIAERSVAESNEDIDGTVLRLAFEDVPIEPGVQDGEEHEFEAILSLPRRGESRYVARLSTIDRQCYWEVDVVGPEISGRYYGSGIRLMSRGDGFSALQLDSGVNPQAGPDTGPVTAVTLPLGDPPSQGQFDGGNQIGLFADNGIIVSISQRGSVDLTTLNEDSTGQTSEVAGAFEAQFKGAVVDRRIIDQAIAIRGRFIGHMSGAHGCGSESFRWFQPIMR